MVSHIAWFEYIICESEIEALVLECNLIKEHHPHYNTMLTDDKSYPYIKITVQEDFPRILFSHQMYRDHARYFGPYTNARAVKDTIDLLKKLYHLRSCNKKLQFTFEQPDVGKTVSSGQTHDSGKATASEQTDNIGKTDTSGQADTAINRPCLYYHIGQCKAPCQGYISKEEYGKNVEQAIHFLTGHHQQTVRELEEKMKQLAADMEFEQAAEVRDLIESIKHIASKQRVDNTTTDDRDVIAMAANERNEGVISVFLSEMAK